jgi:hypothetical protein
MFGKITDRVAGGHDGLLCPQKGTGETYEKYLKPLIVLTKLF